ncbi:MAG TPA: hypothetical protein VIJ15_14295 [Dermatophilaceae bacterium]
MRFDHRHQTRDNSWIKGLLEPRGTKQVPRVDHQVNETKPQERSSRDVATSARNRLPGRRFGERPSLAACRLDHGSYWITAKLITFGQASGLIAINAGQQQRGEPVAHHNMLDQFAHRDFGRRRPIP